MNMPVEMMNMPVVISQYWNIVYGREEGQAALDTEGMQAMYFIRQESQQGRRENPSHGQEQSDICTQTNQYISLLIIMPSA